MKKIVSNIFIPTPDPSAFSDEELRRLWKAEGWAYQQWDNGLRERIAAAVSPRERGLCWAAMVQGERLNRSDLIRTMKETCATGPSGMVLSFSHDNYISTAGGVQNCIADEQKALCAAEWTYLHLYPAHPKPHLADPMPAEDVVLGASLNGRHLGHVYMHDLVAMTTELVRTGVRITPVVHHLLGHVPERVAELVLATGASQPIVWAHDLFALCPSIHLLRNDTTFCGGAPCESSVCGICNAGSERAEHMTRIRSFFRATMPQVLAPSATLLEFWIDHGQMPHAEARVVPLCSLEFTGQSAPAWTAERPLRVGYLGQPTYHKGWNAFEALVRWHEGDPRYAFHILGIADPGVPNLTYRQALVTPNNRMAMADAVTDVGLDVAINWSLCYESFSFTAMEAIAGGAFVIARREAGNVWPLISSIHPNRGRAVSRETELQALFASGDILALAAGADRRLGRMVPGHATGDVLMAESLYA